MGICTLRNTMEPSQGMGSTTSPASGMGLKCFSSQVAKAWVQASPSGNSRKRHQFLEFTQTLRRFNTDGAQGAD